MPVPKEATYLLTLGGGTFQGGKGGGWSGTENGVMLLAYTFLTTQAARLGKGLVEIRENPHHLFHSFFLNKYVLSICLLMQNCPDTAQQL